MSRNDTDALFNAFTKLKTKDELKRFMTDLCTPGEINAFTERWAIARLLNDTDLSYRDIATQTGASTTTVARVARFLRQEPHKGYQLVLKRTSKNKK
jgi:TrpR-related protein YerC/YecD